MKRLDLFALLFCICSQALGAGVALFAGTNPNTLFYVNSATGNDSNNGSIGSPWLTIAHINAQTFAANTEIFLSGTFTDGLVLTTTVTPGPFILTSYGSAQATISTGNSTACVTATNVPSVTIRGITCTGGGNTTNTTAGISIINSQAGNTKLAGATIANNTISGYGFNGINIQGTAGTSGFAGIIISGNTVHDVTGNNSTQTTAGSSCVQVYSNTGYGSGASAPSHVGLTISGNTIYNCTGTATGNSNCCYGNGIEVQETSNFIITQNYVHDVGANSNSTTGGPMNIYTLDNINYTISYNETFRAIHNTIDGDGIGIDRASGTVNVIGNYSHDNGGADFIVGGSFDGTCCHVSPTVNLAFNIGQNARGGSGSGEVEIDVTDNEGGSYNFFRNTFVNQVFGNVVMATNGTMASYTANFGNNIFLGPTGTLVSFLHPSTMSFLGNDYYTYGTAVSIAWNGTTYTSFASWQTATGQEKVGGSNVGLTSNPSIYVPGGGWANGGYVPANLYAYELQAGSAMLSSGVNLQTQFGYNVAGTDYFGATVAAGSTTVGAAEGDFGTFAASCSASTNFLARTSSFAKADNVRYNSTLCGEASDGDLALMDVQWILAAPNSAASLLNSTSSSFALTNHSAVFTACQGYAGDGATKFIDTGWNPSSNAVNYALSSVTTFGYSLTSGIASQQALFGTQNAGGTTETLTLVFNTASTYYLDANDESGTSPPGTVSSGAFVLNRTGSTLTPYHNSINLNHQSTVAPVSLSPVNVWLLGENNNGSLLTPMNGSIAWAGFGSGSINPVNVALRMNAHLQSCGSNTY